MFEPIIIKLDYSPRDERHSNQVKNAVSRLGKRIGSGLIDRPNIGENRRRLGRGRIDIPTGGVRGYKKPTGNRLDFDRDGWADEGTTNPVWVGLSSGQDKPRPTIQTRRVRPKINLNNRKTSERKKIRQKIQYGENLPNGKSISRKNGPKWLDELSNEQISNILVPDSYQTYSQMLADGFGVDKKTIEKYLESRWGVGKPWLEIDYSENSIKELRKALKNTLDESPIFSWAVRNYGSPTYMVLTRKSVQAYNSRDNVKSLYDAFKKMYPDAPGDPHFAASNHLDFEMVTLNPVNIIDKKNWQTNEPVSINFQTSKLPSDSDAVIDRSIPGLILHEWAHWYHSELLLANIESSEKKKRSPKSLLNPEDSDFAEKVKIALEYYSDNGNMNLHSTKKPLEDSPNEPRTITSYGHISKKEMFAEGMLAYMHPNEELKTKAINKKLRQDMETVLAGDKGVDAWKDSKASIKRENNILSSGRKNRKLTKLSSGSKDEELKKPRYPRHPSYGPFLDGADDLFADVNNWEEFKKVYDNLEINFFDYETTGLVSDEFQQSSGNGAPVQFGVTKTKGGKEIGRLNIFMNPGEELGDWSRKNLKDKDGKPLTDEWLSTQVSISDAHKKLIDFVGPNAIFGVQNAVFDKTVLEDALTSSDIEWRPKGWIDTKVVSDLVIPKWTKENQDAPWIIDKETGEKIPSNSLKALTEYLNIDLGKKHHTADADAAATSELMSKIIDKAIEKKWNTDIFDKNWRDQKIKDKLENHQQKIIDFEQEKNNWISKTSPQKSTAPRETEKKEFGFGRLSSGTTSYKGRHESPDASNGAPLHNLANGAIYPEDIYGPNGANLYGFGAFPDLTKKAVAIFRKLRNKPDSELTIYRAVPRGKNIKEGDWVTILPEYAKIHGDSWLKDGYEIATKKVKAKELFNEGNSLLEFGYHSKLSSGKYDNAPTYKGKIWKDRKNELDGPVWPFPYQAKQYPKDGPPGISYFKGVVNESTWVDCLLYRDDSGKLIGILNHYPFALVDPDDPRIVERRGNINIFIDPKHKGKGIGTKLVDEAVSRYNVDLRRQRYSEEGADFINNYIRKLPENKNKPKLSSGATERATKQNLGRKSIVRDSSILEKIKKSFEKASPADSPSTPIGERLLTRLISGINKKDGSPATINDILNFLTDAANRDERKTIAPGFNILEEKIFPIESLIEMFKELGLSRVDVPDSKTKKILGPVIPELADLAGDAEWLKDARDYTLPPLEVWAKAAAKSIMGQQKFNSDVGELRWKFMRRRFEIQPYDGVASWVLKGVDGKVIAFIHDSKLTSRDRNKLQYSNLDTIMNDYYQRVPGVPFMTLVKSHIYPDDPLEEILADSHVVGANGSASLGGENMAESLRDFELTSLNSFTFTESSAGARVKEMFEQAYANSAHYDEFARRYAIRVRTLLSEAGLDVDGPIVKKALTLGWHQIPDTTEEPAERGGRFLSAAMLVRNLISSLYRPSWDNLGETYTTPHEFMHLITGQGFTRHGEMASNIGWLGAFGADVWPTVANLLRAQERFLDMQKEDSQNGDLAEANEKFRIMVLSEIRKLLGGDGDDFGQTSSKLMDELYQNDGILQTAKQDGLFNGFKWIDPLVPLDAKDLGWGSKKSKLSSGAKSKLSSGAPERIKDVWSNGDRYIQFQTYKNMEIGFTGEPRLRDVPSGKRFVEMKVIDSVDGRLNRVPKDEARTFTEKTISAAIDWLLDRQIQTENTSLLSRRFILTEEQFKEFLAADIKATKAKPDLNKKKYPSMKKGFRVDEKELASLSEDKPDNRILVQVPNRFWDDHLSRLSDNFDSPEVRGEFRTEIGLNYSELDDLISDADFYIETARLPDEEFDSMGAEQLMDALIKQGIPIENGKLKLSSGKTNRANRRANSSRLSSGSQPRMNLSDEEKREIIAIASQRTDDFSKSVVAQFRRNGKLSDRQWNALNRATLRRSRLSSGAIGVEEFKNMSDAKHAQILSEAGLSQRGEAENAGQAVWEKGFTGLYQYALEHIGDLYHRAQHRLQYSQYGLDEVDEKIAKILGYLRQPYGFEREVEEQTNGVTAKKPELTIDVLKSLGKKYADAHGKLPVYNLPAELMVKASMHLGNWEFEDAARTLEQLREMLNDEEKWKFMLSRQGTIEYLESKRANNSRLSSGKTNRANNSRLSSASSRKREFLRTTDDNPEEFLPITNLAAARNPNTDTNLQTPANQEILTKRRAARRKREKVNREVKVPLETQLAIVEHYKNPNITLAQIEKKFNVGAQYINNLARQYNLPYRLGPKSRLTEAQKANIIDAIKNGMSHNDILKKFNITRAQLGFLKFISEPGATRELRLNREKTRLENERKQIIKLFNEGLNLREIKERINKPGAHEYVYGVLKADKETGPKLDERLSTARPVSEIAAELRAFLDNGGTIEAASKKFNLSRVQIKRFKSREKAKGKPLRTERIVFTKIIPELIAFLEKGGTYDAAAEKFNLSRKQIVGLVKRGKRKGKIPKTLKARDKRLAPAGRNVEIAEYYAQGATIKELSEMFELSEKYIDEILRNQKKEVNSKLSSGKTNRANRRANSSRLSSGSKLSYKIIKAPKEIDEDDEKYLDNPELFEEDRDALNKESMAIFKRLAKEAQISVSSLEKTKYPDRKLPQRFSEAKIQMMKALTMELDYTGDVPIKDRSVIIARDKDNKIIAAARFTPGGINDSGDSEPLFIHNIAAFGPETDTPGLGASIFNRIIEIASKDNVGILLEPTPTSRKYWENIGFKDIDPDRQFFENGRLYMSPEDVKKLAANRKVDNTKLSSGSTPSSKMAEQRIQRRIAAYKEEAEKGDGSELKLPWDENGKLKEKPIIVSEEDDDFDDDEELSKEEKENRAAVLEYSKISPKEMEERIRRAEESKRRLNSPEYLEQSRLRRVARNKGKETTTHNADGTLKEKKGEKLSSGSLINSEKYRKKHTALLKKILTRMDKEGAGWMDEDMRLARLDELEYNFGKSLRQTIEYWYGGADGVTYNMRDEIESGKISKEVNELLSIIDISPVTSRPIWRGMRYMTQDELDEIINRGVTLPLGAFSGQKSTAISYADGDYSNNSQVSVILRLERGVKAFPMKHFSPIDEEEYLVAGTFEVVSVSETQVSRFGKTVTEVELRSLSSGEKLNETKRKRIT